MAGSMYRREKVEKFASLLDSRKQFYVQKAAEYLPDPANPSAGNMKLWQQNRIKADLYEEVLTEMQREFELDEPMKGGV